MPGKKGGYGKLKSERTPELDDCSENVKKALIGMNFLFMIFGLTLLGLGIYMFVSLGNVKSMISMGLPIALLILGTFIGLLSCFGCCGASRRSKPLLLIYLGLLLILVLAQILVGWYGITQSEDLESKLYDEWKDISNNDKNALQDQFDCCGFYNSTDYPGSDCNNTKAQNDPDLEGCEDKIKDVCKTYLKVIIVIGSIFAAIELIGLITSCLFFCCLSCCYESYEKYEADEEDMEQFLGRIEKY